MKIAIVNDVTTATEALRRLLIRAGEHEIVWTAADGEQAVRQCAEHTPDVILMDLVMPVLNGVEATRQIMANTPCAILIVTATVLGHAQMVFAALGFGAVDAVMTPVFRADGSSEGADDLLSKLARIKRILMEKDSKPGSTGRIAKKSSGCSDRLLLIGASAGGPAAIASVLAALPAEFPAAVVIVQHVDPQFTALMAGWLSDQSQLPVRIAWEGARLKTGHVFLAGGGDHLVFRTRDTLGYSVEPRGYPYRPSINALFESAARFWSSGVVAVLLTGMGRDGALGLRALKNAGAKTIAQDRATCAVYGMPKAAVELGAALEVLPLQNIAPALQRHFEDQTQDV